MLAALCAAGCGSRGAVVPVSAPAPAATGTRVAVFPVENLTGKAVPLADIQQLLEGLLKRRGLDVLDDAALDQLMTLNRVRYTAGVAQDFARALKQQGRVDWIVIPSLESYELPIPPRISLFVRLVSTGEAPAVRWVEGIGIAGDDHPGLLGLGLVEDPGVLLERAMDILAASLVHAVSEPGGPAAASPAAKFRPKIVYRSDGLDPGRIYTVAVVPFFNRSETPNAGEIVALQMMRSLMAFPRLRVVEPGIVREELLRYRIIMTDGVSLPETETILDAVNADLVLNGEVLQYRDRFGPEGTPSVDFGVLFIERTSRRIVYSAYSRNTGTDRVFFFDYGRVNTAHAMTRQMTEQVVRRMLGDAPRAASEER